MTDYWSYVREKITDTIQSKYKTEINNWNQADWEKLAESYAYEDVKDKLGTKAVDEIKQAVSGIVLFQNGKFHLADLSLHEAASSTKDFHVRLRCICAYVHVLIDANRYYHSENVLKFAIRSTKAKNRGDVKFAELYFLLGLVLLKQRKSDEAIEAIKLYNFSIEEHNKDSKSPDFESLSKGYRFLGSAFIQKRNHHAMLDAEENYKKVIEKNLKNINELVSTNNLANYYINKFQNGDEDGILWARIYIEDAEKLLKFFIDKKKFRTNNEQNLYASAIKDTRAMYEIVNENFDKAIEILKVALELLKNVKGTTAITIHYHLGMAYEHKKKYNQAKAEFLKALSYEKTHQVDPFEVAKVYDGLGVIYSKQKKFDAAKKMFREAVELNPHDHAAESHLELISGTPSNNKDWWAWWMQSNGKKIGLGLISFAIVSVLLLPYANDSMLEKTSVSEIIVNFPLSTEKSTTTGNNSSKSTTTNNGTSVTEDLEVTDTSTVTNEKSTSNIANSNKTTTTTSYKYTPSEIHLGLVGILVFIILLPSIKKIKAGGVEIEAKDMSTQDTGGVIITPPTL